MTKFPMNTRVSVLTTDSHDFYIMHTACGWFVEAFPVGSLDVDQESMCCQATLKAARRTVETWSQWMK